MGVSRVESVRMLRTSSKSWLASERSSSLPTKSDRQAALKEACKLPAASALVATAAHPNGLGIFCVL